MADSSIVSGGSLNSATTTLLNDRAQDRLVKNFCFYKFADKVNFPGRSGSFTFQFRRFDNINGSTSTLAESTLTAGATQLSAQVVTGTVSQYGQFVTIPAYTQDLAADDTIKAAVDGLTDAASDTVDLLVRAAYDSGTAYIPNGKTTASLTNSDVFRAADVRKLVRNLTRSNTRTFDDKTYVSILHPDQMYDLQSDSDAGGWIDTNRYTNYKAIHDGEMGMLYGVRFIQSNNCASATTAQVGTAVTSGKVGYIFGSHAVSVIDLEKNPINILVKKPGSAGSADPYSNIATVAYKIKAFGAVWTGGDGPRAYKLTTPTTV